MIKIGICDDEKIILEVLEKMVKKSLEYLKVKGEIFLFSQGTEVLLNEKELDMLFLDIEMPQLDGIEIGKRLREQNSECKIIMATSRVERFKEAFRINAFRFITKPFEIEEVQEVLAEAVSAIDGADKIEVYKERVQYNILQKDILYVEAIESAVEFILKEGIFRKESSLTEMEKILDKKIFYRINRQCIVNMAKIEKFEKGLVFINNENKKISQRRRKEFIESYREYMAWK